MYPQCTIEGCMKPQHGQGLCTMHYQRLRHHGDPLAPVRLKVGAGTECLVDECKRLHYRRGYCKPHYTRLRKYGDPLAGDALPENVDNEDGRLCTKCHLRKPLTEFHKSSTSRLGRSRICRACTKIRVDAYYAKNPERAKALNHLSRIRRVYGDRGLEVEERRLAGDGCDACGRRIAEMTIDHCHETGVTRGLLCKPCNFILGIAGDDPERLRALANYLERFMATLSGTENCESGVPLLSSSG